METNGVISRKGNEMVDLQMVTLVTLANGPGLSG